MSGALYARTLVVEISSSGAEIVFLSIGPSQRLTLVMRVGDGGEVSGRLLRLVNALTSAMVVSAGNSCYATVSGARY